MNKRIYWILIFVFLNGCSAIVLEKGINYEKREGYYFDRDKSSGSVTIRNNNNNYVNIASGKVACGYYGVIGPLIFPIIPIWENRECDNVTIRIWEYYTGIRNVHIILQGKNYQPIEISEMNYYTFPLKTKSITDTAILVVEKNDGEIFEIPIRYKHSFSFDLWPGR